MAILRHHMEDIIIITDTILPTHTIHQVPMAAIDTTLKLIVARLEMIQSASVRRQWLRYARSHREDRVAYYDDSGRVSRNRWTETKGL